MAKCLMGGAEDDIMDDAITSKIELNFLLILDIKSLCHDSTKCGLLTYRPLRCWKQEGNSL